MPSLTVLPPTNRLYEYLFPLFIILSSLTALPATLWSVLKTRPRDIFFPSRWLDEWFARIWSDFTAMPFTEEKRRIAAESSGVVIELGPGFGDSLEHYDKATVGHVYLVEPNLDMHEGLRKNIEKFGWEGRATIVGCGIEDTEGLKKAGVPEEGVDTVVAIQVFCSVPTPEKVLPEIYKRLKKGGKLRIFEHIQSRESTARWLQGLYDLVWHIPLGGCSLSRPTDRSLVDPEYMGFKEGEGWKDVDLNKVIGESRHSCIPCVWGSLTKA